MSPAVHFRSAAARHCWERAQVVAPGQTPPASEAPPAVAESAADLRPFSAIEPGMHTALINRIAVDRALFVHPDRQRWILWTPHGFLDASPGGATRLGYHLNSGRNATGTFISSAQLQQRFYRSNLVARRLGDDERRSLLARIPNTKSVVVLDTCNSGAFGLGGRALGEKGAIDRLASRTGGAR